MSDEERRKVLKPNLCPSDVQCLLETYFLTSVKVGLDSTSPPTVVKQLDSYDDQNFLVKLLGVEYLLKVHNGVESDNSSVIDLQNSLMLHLNKDPRLCTTSPLVPSSPSVLQPSPPNSVLVSLPVVSPSHSPHPLVVRLLTYLPGVPLAYKSVTPSLLLSCGSYLAAIDSSLDVFPPHPAAERHHAWDGKNTVGLRSFLSYIPTDSKRELVSSVIDAFEKDILPFAKDFRTGVLQGDFNDANIIVGHDDKVKGVIDFGDAVNRLVS